MRSLLRSKIHRATVTETNVEYVGSITIDAYLMLEADIWPGERVLVSNLDNGARFETYVIKGKAGSGIIGINGAAAHLVEKGNRVIIMGFEITDEPISPIILVMDEGNRVQRRVRC
ncbi:MAG: aspartate 1-decarboxylase [Methanomassiliicoccales archaeon]